MLLWDLETGGLNLEIISIEIINRLQIVFIAIDCVNSLGTEHGEERRSPSTEPGE